MAVVSSREGLFLAAGLLVGSAIGGAVTYFTTKQSLEKDFYDRVNEAIDDEVAEVKKHYDGRLAVLEKDSLQEIVEKKGYVQTVREHQDEIRTATAGVPPTKLQNIFKDAPPPPDNLVPIWDYAKETKARAGKTTPFVIHADEFRANEEENEQSTLTYFAGDDVLCDERDEPIDNRDAMIGDENLNLFGYGSGDPNIIFVRNPELEIDFEIVQSEGKFATEVHGFPDEDLEHSAYRRMRPRNRFSDDE